MDEEYIEKSLANLKDSIEELKYYKEQTEKIRYTLSFGKLKDAYKYNVQIPIKLQNLKSYNIGVKSDRDHNIMFMDTRKNCTLYRYDNWNTIYSIRYSRF